ncbi:MAG: hypothetical protein NTV51_13710, partial [Verrucomicrobia bacterium]|nr:hypothetical protein [Verrucomicrobiota bacterium]
MRAAPSGGSALPGPGAEHRGALLRYATRLLEKAAEHAGEVVDATLAQAAMESAVAGTPAAEAGGPDGGTGAAADDRAVEKLF